jgi:hypothetical protein
MVSHGMKSADILKFYLENRFCANLPAVQFLRVSPGNYAPMGFTELRAKFRIYGVSFLH